MDRTLAKVENAGCPADRHIEHPIDLLQCLSGRFDVGVVGLRELVFDLEDEIEDAVTTSDRIPEMLAGCTPSRNAAAMSARGEVVINERDNPFGGEAELNTILSVPSAGVRSPSA